MGGTNLLLLFRFAQTFCIMMLCMCPSQWQQLQVSFNDWNKYCWHLCFINPNVSNVTTSPGSNPGDPEAALASGSRPLPHARDGSSGKYVGGHWMNKTSPEAALVWCSLGCRSRICICAIKCWSTKKTNTIRSTFQNSNPHSQRRRTPGSWPPPNLSCLWFCGQHSTPFFSSVLSEEQCQLNVI